MKKIRKIKTCNLWVDLAGVECCDDPTDTGELIVLMPWFPSIGEGLCLGLSRIIGTDSKVMIYGI